MMKGKIRKLDLGWIVDYEDDDNRKKTIGLHPEDAKILIQKYSIEEMIGLEIDFEIVNHEPTKNTFIDFAKIICAL